MLFIIIRLKNENFTWENSNEKPDFDCLLERIHKVSL